MKTSIIFTTQYKKYKERKIVIEMVRGRWVWSIDDIEISDYSFETPDLAFEDAKEFIDTL